MADETPPEESPDVEDANAEDSTPDATDEPTNETSTDDNAESTDETSDNAADDASPEPDENVRTPEFPDLKATPNPAGAKGEINRLYDVEVTVAAELGRTSVPIQTLLGLSEGSVFELDRSISSPIELVAQGIPLGNGEVVVVDDSFAIRIKEIYANPT
jgi:flagellar motor switch protein FliN/FliY